MSRVTGTKLALFVLVWSLIWITLPTQNAVLKPIQTNIGRAMIVHDDALHILEQEQSSNSISTGMAFSPDGKWLAISFDDGLRIYPANLSLPGRVFTQRPGPVNTFAFSVDSKRIVAAEREDALVIWDVEAGKRVRTLSGHQQPIYSLAFSPDGKLVASGGLSKTVILWEVSTGRVVHYLVASTQYVSNVLFSPNGTVLATNIGRSIRFWDVRSWKLLRDLDVDYLIRQPTFLSGGIRLATLGGNRTLRLYDVQTGEVVETWTDLRFNRLATQYGPDEKVIMVNNLNVPLSLLDTNGNIIQTFVDVKGDINVFALSPDGKTLASLSIEETTIRLWDVATGKQLKTLPVNQ